MSYRGGSALSWQSDYGQFYLLDLDAAAAFTAPVDISDEMMRKRWHQTPGGLVVYTNDCLQQVIEVRVFGEPREADPLEWRSGQAWTQSELTSMTFPSRLFVVSSPSRAGTEAYGPIFRVDTAANRIRIQWMESDANRDDGVPVQPDVIRLELWPA